MLENSKSFQVGKVESILDSSSSDAMLRETSMGNFVTDTIRDYYETDVAFILGKV
jgi:hypothetical protein